jgi:hypothetical protein
MALPKMGREIMIAFDPYPSMALPKMGREIK